jgi:hypothetical protein
MASENQIETFDAVLRALKSSGYDISYIEFDMEGDKVAIHMVDQQERQLVSDHR